MKGARALASGMLVLAAICAVPAVSAAQDSGTPAATSTTTTTPEPTEPLGTTTAPDTPPAGPSAGGPSPPSGGSAVRQPIDGGSPGVPAAAPAAVASAASGAKARKASSISVTIGDFFFRPGAVTVHTGDTITWRNTGQAPHNATADDGSFSTPTLNQGQSASHTFSSAGTFSYICTIHPNMKATVRVLSASGSAGGGSTSSSSSGTSEASAVASPDAAGTSSTLPMTGMAVGGLALVGAALLASGLITRRSTARD